MPVTVARIAALLSVSFALGFLALFSQASDRGHDPGVDANRVSHGDRGEVGRAPNLKVSAGGRFNGEPTIAVNPTDPDNVVAAWMHSGAPEMVEIMVASSEDAGGTWSTPISLGHVNPVYTTSADVSVAFNRAGTAHLTFIEIEAGGGNPECEFQIESAEVVHRRSSDGGATWSAPVRVRHSDDNPFFAIDRPWVAVDSSGGPRDGWVYLVSISFYCNNPGPPQHVYLKRSTDQGETWSAEVQVDNAVYSTGPYPDLPFPAVVGVGGDGVLWVVYPSAGSAACGGLFNVCLLAAVSTDGGQTFTRSKIADVTPAGSRGYPLFQTLAADLVRPGRCSVFWPDGRYEPDGSDLLLARSEDGGQSWSEPVRVNDNPPGEGVGLGQPWAAAGTHGSLALVWRDRRASGTGAEVPFEVYVAMSVDGGDHFLPNLKLSDQPSPYSEVPCCNSFLGLAISGGRLHANWGDFREGLWEIFYAQEAVNLLFADGFELGDTSTWSRAQG